MAHRVWRAVFGLYKINFVIWKKQSSVRKRTLAGKADIDAAVIAAQRALRFGPWSKTIPEERQSIIERFINLYDAYNQELAELITKENGSPLW